MRRLFRRGSPQEQRFYQGNISVLNRGLFNAIFDCDRNIYLPLLFSTQNCSFLDLVVSLSMSSSNNVLLFGLGNPLLDIAVDAPDALFAEYVIILK